MITDGYRFQFKEGVNLRDAEDTLLLSLLAAEGIYGAARVRMDCRYTVEPTLNVIVIGGSKQAGQDVAGIFTAFVTKEFGPAAFVVRPLGQEVRS
jgi:hypothetical protein